MRVIIAAFVLATTLAGCTSSSQFTPSPAGISGKPNGLRRTPCAGGCGEVRQHPGLPGFLKAAA
jgi:hypothetical protein